MSKTKFYNLSALIILAVFQMWERIEGPSGLLINRFFDTVFLCFQKLSAPYSDTSQSAYSSGNLKRPHCVGPELC
jgi:hypothetical protein